LWLATMLVTSAVYQVPSRCKQWVQTYPQSAFN